MMHTSHNIEENHPTQTQNIYDIIYIYTRIYICACHPFIYIWHLYTCIWHSQIDNTLLAANNFIEENTQTARHIYIYLYTYTHLYIMPPIFTCKKHIYTCIIHICTIHTWPQTITQRSTPRLHTSALMPEILESQCPSTLSIWRPSVVTIQNFNKKPL